MTCDLNDLKSLDPNWLAQLVSMAQSAQRNQPSSQAKPDLDPKRVAGSTRPRRLAGPASWLDQLGCMDKLDKLGQ